MPIECQSITGDSLLEDGAGTGVKYRCGPFTVTPLGSDFAVAYVGERDRAELMARPDLQMLLSCGQFRTITEHAATIAGKIAPEAHCEAIHLLQRAVKSGLFISLDELLTRCDRAHRSDRPRPLPIDWLVIPTRDRQQPLLASVDSYIRHLKRFDRSIKIFISDATDGPNADELRKGLWSMASGSGVDIYYAGVAEKVSFTRLLAKSADIPTDVLTFALFGESGGSGNFGANRNTTLLQTVGSLLFSVDDDTECQAAAVSGRSDSLSFGSEADPSEVWSFDNRQTARAFLEPVQFDILGAHEQLLGLPLRSLVAAAGSGIDFQQSCGHLLSKLWFGHGQVLSTYNGLVGDAGVFSVLPFIVSPSKATKDRLTITQDVYHRALTSREIVRQVLAPTVSHGVGAVSLAMFVGLDNRGILPPFFPVFRGEDLAFGYMLTLCHEDSCIGHVPLTLLHNRQEPGRFGEMSTTRMSDLVVGALSSCGLSFVERSCSARMIRLGSHLCALGSLCDHDFREWVRGISFRRAGAIISNIEAVLKRESSHPSFWAEDLRARADAVALAVADGRCAVPDEFRSGHGLHGAKESLLQYGELLRWWPSIIEGTRRLAETGIRIGGRIRG